LSYLSRVLSYLATRKQSLLASAGCAAVPRISMSDISIHSIADKWSSRKPAAVHRAKEEPGGALHTRGDNLCQPGLVTTLRYREWLAHNPY
jgi:hypothetical protein